MPSLFPKWCHFLRMRLRNDGSGFRLLAGLNNHIELLKFLVLVQNGETMAITCMSGHRTTKFQSGDGLNYSMASLPQNEAQK